MNKVNLDLLKLIKKNAIHNQRELADLSGYSLGLVNREIKKLRELKLVDEEFRMTSKAKTLFKKNKPKKGITLIALVITIIILLLLAAVTIQIALGDNRTYS